ncbi:phage GP46 family protein [Paraburkholderia caballeronis]|uniref:Mu-like prophage protein gp46 n=1 Tax=Paraburkholderia caballeronis TaxID=416943 RepID=A0A1H7TZB2_9BURK|nr:phage GP46 family protein [Paraburkholderia caballeronis]PXW23415.1 phage gp46-like protein [Paraburkholderia caballeronis]PXW98408.1 phage gp46-like protein [Paraburkholderia caballeronis]RAJ95139.1 phage gp46-like protein [Paraburkholderia caballeronis]SEC54855.1 Mu-like prophage protein gp46 [Paraburkholderia caballeronis]SEL90013.1 Mu-like prophage protein gp46 [Paraburkholderia caballeronis]
MSDIRIVWDVANARGDWALLADDIATGNDLETALLLSLFTDREAATDDVIPDGSNDRRGWWGDDGNIDGLGPTGSRLWLLSRRKSPTDQTLRDAYDYIVEAIQWLIDTGVVARFDVNVQWVKPDMLGAVVVAWPPDGGAAQTFNWAWSEVN